MKYLLDTHVFIWALFDPEKLSAKVKKVIDDPQNSIYISIITFWEISLKYNLGKLLLKNVLPDDLPHYAEESGFEILELDPESVASFYRLPRTPHKDPFDRLLIWQCICEKITLVSKDIQMSSYKEFRLKTLW